MATVNIDYGKMMAQTTITVNIRGFNKVQKARRFLALFLFNLGAFVLGCKLGINKEDGPKNKYIPIVVNYNTPKPPAPKPESW